MNEYRMKRIVQIIRIVAIIIMVALLVYFVRMDSTCSTGAMEETDAMEETEDTGVMEDTDVMEETEQVVEFNKKVTFGLSYHKPSEGKWYQDELYEGRIMILTSRNGSRVMIMDKQENVYSNHAIEPTFEFSNCLFDNKVSDRCLMWRAIDFSYMKDYKLKEFNVLFNTDDDATEFSKIFTAAKESKKK